MIRNILTIAGSDPSGGAGVQADLKTFSALGCYGMAAITALTAQNTKGVTGIHDVPPDFVVRQVAAVFSDIRVDAVKIGMVGGSRTVTLLADFLQRRKPPVIVLDPVIGAQSGDRLTDEETVRRLKIDLLPLASVVTPNIPEAEILLGRAFDGDMERFAKGVLQLGARAVLLKGGHLEGDTSKDIYIDREMMIVLEERRIKTKNNHGTGCTLSSALTAYMARGLPANEAAAAAKKYLTYALQNADALTVGNGAGPVNHFYAQWK